MRKVLVTGASRGIGAACARRFAAAGDRVVINYKSSEQDARRVCEDTGGLLCRADLADPAAVREMAELHSDTEVLVNNAGVSLFGLFDAISEADAAAMYAVDLHGAINCARALLPHMLRRKSGVIINISSVWGECGASCEVDYSAAKAGIIGFTRALAKEVGPAGIRVCCVCPGVVDTDMNMRLTPAEVAEIVEAIPLERLGTPAEVAEGVFFLASPQASYITGAVLDIGGGF